MNESIYHVYANYCGERRLMFAGYKSRVWKRFNFTPEMWLDLLIGPISWHFGCARDRWGNALPYTFWSGPITIAEFVPTTEVVEYEGEAA
jgi:hypothetical protein